MQYTVLHTHSDALILDGNKAEIIRLVLAMLRVLDTNNADVC